MKCHEKDCQREATVHLTEIINDNITKLHLCEDHAKQKGIEMEQHFGVADLLQGLAEYTPKTIEPKKARSKCVNCGMIYEDFKKIGRLGCADCYITFESNLGPLLKRIHGSNQHVGKSFDGPRKTGIKTKAAAKPDAKPAAHVDVLKAKLKKAIATEAYEEAARLRDEIRNAESQGKQTG